MLLPILALVLLLSLTEAKFKLGKREYESKEAFIKSGKRCGTRNPTVEEAERYELDHQIKLHALSPHLRAKVGGTIDVYFHVITSSTGEGDLTEDDVDAQIAVLNKSYKGSKWKFVLKKMTKTANDEWFNLPTNNLENKVVTAMKTELREGGAEALNIYSCDPDNGILGFATFPVDYQESGVLDGVVIHYATLPGGSLAPYDLGLTATHEVGHWFGLYHTFQFGCVENPTKGGDRCADTPAEKEPNFGCPTKAPNSCKGEAFPGKDPIHNYMDYTDDICMTEFTEDQFTRMNNQFNTYRAGK